MMNYLNRKNLIFRFSLIAIFIFSLSSCDPDETQVVTTLDKLVMAEEFDGTTLNPTIWKYNIGTGENGWGNNELQYYTNSTNNVKVEDGVLKITAIKENFNGSGYTSGRILTKDLYEKKYGRIEARIKLPFGKGYWPAFWMLGADIQEGDETPDDPATVVWPQAGEIDIMEYLGDAPTEIFGTVHGPGYSGGESISKSYTLENSRFDSEFHVFGIEWGENYINFYVDDVLYNQITPEDVPGEWVFNKPYFLILNVAVGGNLPGSPNADTIFPQTMEVDYVRVYE